MSHRHAGTRVGLALAASVLAGACAHPPPAPTDQAEERRLAGADGWLLGSALGLGPAVPVTFMHGVGGNHHFFDPQLTDLRTGRRVLAFDQRGCGGSADAPKGLYDLDTRVRDLGMVLDAVRFDPVILVGHGTGVQVVARYAERNPARVLGLVLVNPVSANAEAARVDDLPDGEFRPALEAWLGTLLGRATPRTRDQVLASAREARIPAMRAMLADAAGTDLSGSLVTYPGPVLILAAPGESLPTPLRPGIETRRLSAGSHWSPLDAPDEVNAALREFLKPLDEAALKRRRSG
ncbi:MAG TPA: alpha/beta fold hydrolase [Myxococcaceae bacterium]|nr:alpha/beta fold hydrolase [Myxococcaceae bacterium]